MPVLFLLFIVVPIVEIALFVQVGGWLGLLPTLLIVIATAALGTWMLRQQGLRTLHTARTRLDAGQLPAQELVEGMVLLVGGALLLTPGFMTDAVGFLCLLPASRAWLASRIGARVLGGTAFVGVGATGGPTGRVRDGAPGAAPGSEAGGDPVGDPAGGPAPSRFDQRADRPTVRPAGRGDIIDGDYERLD